MKSRSPRLLQALAGAIATMGCATDAGVSADASVTTGSPTLSRDIQPILDMYCVKCHALGAPEPHGNPHFTRDVAKASLQGLSACTSGEARVRLVVAGKPDESFLLYKLGAPTTLTIAGMPCNQMMPFQAGDPLADTDPDAVARVRQWIIDGAP